MANERKRGEKLEVAILEAANEIIQTSGYEKMTFQNVAKLAKTSRTVIYRRYETPIHLLHALVKYKSNQAIGGRLVDLFEEKGSLRADLVAAMELYQQFFESVGSKVLSAVLFELRQSNKGFQPWINQAREGNIEIMKKVQDFAKRRGEIKHEFSKIQMTMPFDVLRVENVANGGKVTKEYIIQLVDEVLMPIYLYG